MFHRLRHECGSGITALQGPEVAPLTGGRGHAERRNRTGSSLDEIPDLSPF